MNLNNERHLAVGWKVSSLSPSIASVRYRALLPMLALEDRGVQCRLFSDGNLNNLRGLDVLVIVKSFTADDICLAQEAQARGIPVVFDLCDNIFIDGYGKADGHPGAVFLSIANYATAIVTTTEPLADEIRRHVGSSVPVYIVPDGIETEPLIEAGRRRLIVARPYVLISWLRKLTGQAYKLIRKLKMLRTASFTGLMRRLAGRCRKFLHWRYWAKKAYRRYDALRSRWHGRPMSTQTIAPNEISAPTRRTIPADAVFESRGAIPVGGRVRRILWFGNHGAPHARFGMLDLLEIREALEGIATEFPVELVVISNNPEKYRHYILPLAIPSRYVEWAVGAMAQHLRAADVVVIPNTRDPFSICKSANRSVLALLHGTPVVATRIPALMPLSECCELDDFQSGLRRYLIDTEYARRHVDRGQKLIAELYGQPTIGAAWLNILEMAIKAPRRSQEESGEFIIALNLIQDLDLAVPVLQAAQQRSLAVEAWCSQTLFVKSPRVKTTLDVLGIRPLILPEQLDKLQIANLFRKAKALLTVSETNLGPHRFTHHLTKVARKAGIVTGTMQHGFENIGLTYSDDLHAIDKINFAAERIYTWGPLQTLHPDIPSQSRVKCFPVGCPKPADSIPANLTGLLPAEGIIVGIFENLHWHRYSDDYRRFFLDGVQRLATAFPHITFLVKPHHAGVWLTGRHTGDKPDAPNLIIADPQDPAWEPFTATQLLGHLHAVITSPSTVALDAARIGLPVAVVAHTLNCDNYTPLFSIRTEDEWLGFIDAANAPPTRAGLIESGQKFVNRVLMSGDAAELIVDDMVARIHTRAKRVA